MSNLQTSFGKGPDSWQVGGKRKNAVSERKDREKQGGSKELKKNDFLTNWRKKKRGGQVRKKGRKAFHGYHVPKGWGVGKTTLVPSRGGRRKTVMVWVSNERGGWKKSHLGGGGGGNIIWTWGGL